MPNRVLANSFFNPIGYQPMNIPVAPRYGSIDASLATGTADLIQRQQDEGQSAYAEAMAKKEALLSQVLDADKQVYRPKMEAAFGQIEQISKTGNYRAMPARLKEVTTAMLNDFGPNSQFTQAAAYRQAIQSDAQKLAEMRPSLSSDVYANLSARLAQAQSQGYLGQESGVFRLPTLIEEADVRSKAYEVARQMAENYTDERIDYETGLKVRTNNVQRLEGAVLNQLYNDRDVSETLQQRWIYGNDPLRDKAKELERQLQEKNDPQAQAKAFSMYREQTLKSYANAAASSNTIRQSSEIEQGRGLGGLGRDNAAFTALRDAEISIIGIRAGEISLDEAVGGIRKELAEQGIRLQELSKSAPNSQEYKDTYARIQELSNDYNALTPSVTVVSPSSVYDDDEMVIPGTLPSSPEVRAVADKYNVKGMTSVVGVPAFNISGEQTRNLENAFAQHMASGEPVWVRDENGNREVLRGEKAASMLNNENQLADGVAIYYNPADGRTYARRSLQGKENNFLQGTSMKTVEIALPEQSVFSRSIPASHRRFMDLAYRLAKSPMNLNQEVPLDMWVVGSEGNRKAIPAPVSGARRVQMDVKIMPTGSVPSPDGGSIPIYKISYKDPLTGEEKAEIATGQSSLYYWLTNLNLSESNERE